jgi:hypothetical protein
MPELRTPEDLGREALRIENQTKSEESKMTNTQKLNTGNAEAWTQLARAHEAVTQAGIDARRKDLAEQARGRQTPEPGSPQRPWESPEMFLRREAWRRAEGDD